MALADAPAELQAVIRQFWPENQWDNAAEVSRLESAWDPFAVLDTRTAEHPCGAVFTSIDGVRVSAELSIGYFQINACNFPAWEWQRLYNAYHNAGTAHMLWAQRGWSPWYFSAERLGLL